jgi:hypothetical protein
VLEALEPYSDENGGPLSLKHVSFVEGRGNILVTYPGEPGGGIMSFVGCHLDVVSANPDTWDFDPFTLTRCGPGPCQSCCRCCERPGEPRRRGPRGGSGGEGGGGAVAAPNFPL